MTLPALTADSLVQLVARRLRGQLRNIGVGARITSGGQALPRLGGRLNGILAGNEAQGFIEIDSEAIRWANVVVWVGCEPDEVTVVANGYVRYGVPDARLAARAHKGVFTLVRRPCVSIDLASPASLTGSVWRGKDHGLGIVRRLNGDTRTNTTLKEHSSRGYYWPDRTPVWVRTLPRQPFWLIWTHLPGHVMGDVLSSFEEREALSKDLWKCYLAIARRLLENPLD